MNEAIKKRIDLKLKTKLDEHSADITRSKFISLLVKSLKQTYGEYIA
jgi:hypothetical protein